ncbi:MAG: DUF1801 domain-containing protein [Chitinophagaceae bacterium]|nr:DUF1801 domain-containing protein [Chitinophagaceae bacterium]
MNAVDIYLDELPPTQKIIAQKVRSLILELVPNVQEKFSYKLPFYHFFGILCFINKIPNGIDVGFCRGQDLLDEFPQLEVKKRKILASIALYNIKDIKEKELREIIIAAAIWNEEAKKNNISIFKKKK